MGGRPARPGLREHKKQLTRARIVDAALELLDRQGYAHTTVEKIAEAAHVSPRTVSHYFPSKDHLLLAPVDDYLDAVDTQLRRVPPELPPLQAMLAANLAVLDESARTDAVLSASRLAALLRLMHSAPPLQQLARSLRSDEVTADMARRLATSTPDRRVDLALSVWVAIMATAFSGVTEIHADADPVTADLPALLRARLTEAMAAFAMAAAPSPVASDTALPDPALPDPALPDTPFTAQPVAALPVTARR